MYPGGFPDDPVLRGILKTAFAASLGIFNIYRSGVFSVERKNDRSHLTSADILSNKICHKGLMETLPGAGWLSEESIDVEERLSLNDVWIVDPIDGTREFVEGVDEFSISIGLARQGKAAYGAIAIPPRERIIFGGMGFGVYDFKCDFLKISKLFGEFILDDHLDVDLYYKKFKELWPEILKFSDLKKGEISCKTDLESADILVSRTEWQKGKYIEHEKYLRFFPSGSVARKLGLIAVGEGDLAVSLNPKNDWDICGGIALVLASGGAAIELENFSQRVYNEKDPLSFGLIAGNEILVKKFSDYLKTKKFYA